MRPWKTIGILAFCVVASVAATEALNDYLTYPDLDRRPRGTVLDAADQERVYSHNTPLQPVTERTHFDHTLLVKDLSGKEVRLDFVKGKHIVLLAGWT